MKSLQFLIFLVLFIYISSSGCYGINPTRAADCKDEALEDKRKANGVHCCYLTYKQASDGEEHKSCIEISKSAYKNMKDYIKYCEMMDEEDYDYSVDCKAVYLQFSLIILFLLFL